MNSEISAPTKHDYIRHGIFFNLYGWIQYFPSPVGDILRLFFARIFMKSCGKVRIYEGVKLWYPYRIEIGDNTTLNENVYLNGYGKLRIGSGVRIGHGVSILTSDHAVYDVQQDIKDSGLIAKPVQIGNNVFIGCKATIMSGVTIGDNAVIAAGAVVTKNIPEYAIAAGVPAKVLGDRRKTKIVARNNRSD